jgi:hypothetical protein
MTRAVGPSVAFLVQLQVRKSELEKRKNDDEQEEGWVQCDACCAWVHMICGMFNKGRNDDEMPYHCPNCLMTGDPSHLNPDRLHAETWHQDYLLWTKLLLACLHVPLSHTQFAFALGELRGTCQHAESNVVHGKMSCMILANSRLIQVTVFLPLRYRWL